MDPFPVTLVCGVVLSALLAACGASAGSPAASPATRQVQVSPVTGRSASRAGSRWRPPPDIATCEPGSEAIGRAYRCFAGNAIYDPCWAEKAATPTVLCLPYPWSLTRGQRCGSARQLGAIPGQGGPARASPGAWNCAGGQRCLLAQGAHTEFAGRVIDYYCSAELWLLRGLTESGAGLAGQQRDHLVRGQAGARAGGADPDRLVRPPGHVPLTRSCLFAALTRWGVRATR